MSRYEQPKYSVVAEREGYDIRQYESYLAAETTVSGEFDAPGNAAFRRLAGYIFGRNAAGLRMNMTVPVTRHEISDRTYRYRFVMESAYSEEELPSPLDESVAIVRVPGGHVAAKRYRGGRGEDLYQRMVRRMLRALERDGVATAGDPFGAVYDGPMKPPILRRNEVLVPVEWP